MPKQDAPFHLRDVDPDQAVFPKDVAGIEPEDDTNDIELGSIETAPGINYAEYKATGKGLTSSARVTEDGRIVISLHLKQKLPDLPQDYAQDVREFAVDTNPKTSIPPLNIVVMIVGSRGDVQPYVALGKRLVKHGHRVRIATHETFRSFVTSEGLEFYCIGGDPQELMSYMVKNPGLMPGFESLTNGDIGRKKKMVAEILQGCWKACVERDKDSGKLFAADAIISNPPTFAHIHCAEALGIPLQMSFTMPWSPTTSFSHPLVNVSQSNAESGLTNYLSYSLADLLTWQGLGDVINGFRTKTLGLEPLSLRSGPGIIDRVKVPWTYCMSPSLVPKPADWKNHIDIVGFYFLEQSASYKPPEDLDKFLKRGDPPIYIGFGSVVVEDATEMTKTIFEAVNKSGVRALVSAGWGGLGGVDVPESVFILKTAVPHDWLFSRVFAVCHHGGAGTTAIGLRMGKPTIIVPFFGDQPWWGRQVAIRGAGPEPIPVKKLTSEGLANAIKFTKTQGAQEAVGRMSDDIKKENGIDAGVDSFHQHLPLLNMRCDLDSSRLAVWWSTEYCLKLSSFAAQVLSDAKLLEMNKLDPHRAKEYDTHRKVSDPITGGGSAIFWTVTHYYVGIAKIFYNPVEGIIETTTAIPKGVMNIVTSIHEGFHNAPKLYGSEVRESGQVTDFKSGLKEAGKGFFYGYYDGITGLVTEPVKGAKKEGFAGVVKGALRSYVNVTMRPAAGAVGLVAHPAAGAWKSVQKLWAREKMDEQRLTRISDGVEVAKLSSRADAVVIVERFKEAKTKTDERRKSYLDRAEKVFKQDVDDATSTVNETQPSSGASVSAASSSQETAVEDEERYQNDLAEATKQSLASNEPSRQSQEDEKYQKEFEIARQISLAEKRGFERGLARRAADG